MGRYDNILSLFDYFKNTQIDDNISDNYQLYGPLEGYDVINNKEQNSQANILIDKLLNDIIALQEHYSSGRTIGHNPHNKRESYAYGSFLYGWYDYCKFILDNAYDSSEGNIERDTVNDLDCIIFSRKLFQTIKDMFPSDEVESYLNDGIFHNAMDDDYEERSYMDFLRNSYKREVLADSSSYVNIKIFTGVVPFGGNKYQLDNYYNAYCMRSYCDTLSKSYTDNMIKYYKYMPNEDFEELDYEHYVRCISGLYNICDGDFNYQDNYSELDDIIFTYIANTFEQLLPEIVEQNFQLIHRLSLNFSFIDVWYNFYKGIYSIIFPKTEIPAMEVRRRFIFMQLLGNRINEYFNVDMDRHVSDMFTDMYAGNTYTDIMELVPFKCSQECTCSLSSVIFSYHDLENILKGSRLNFSETSVNLSSPQNLLPDISDYLDNFINDFIRIRHMIRKQLTLSGDNGEYEFSEFDISNSVTQFKNKYLFNNGSYDYTNLAINMIRNNMTDFKNLEEKSYPKEAGSFSIIDMSLPDYKHYSWYSVIESLSFNNQNSQHISTHNTDSKSNGVQALKF